MLIFLTFVFHTDMDAHYIPMLYDLCHEIQQEEVALVEIQRRLLPRHVLPIYRLQPAINLLSRLRVLLKRLIHTHHRDIMRLIRAEWQS